MAYRRPLLVLSLLSLALAAPARGEGTGSNAEGAIELQSNLGLTGFRDMIDARTPGVLSIRFGSRYRHTTSEGELSGDPPVERREERHELRSAVGVSVLGMLDVGGQLPYLFTDDDTDVEGEAGPAGESERGWGDLDLAAKVSLEVGPFLVAPYFAGRLPTAEPAVEDLASLDYGVAASFSALNEYVALHANVAGVQEESGVQALRYRLGFSLVPFAMDDYLLRLYCYGDGIELEGSAASDIDLEFGAQAFVFANLWVELGAGVRVVDAGAIDDELERQVRGVDGGDLGRHIRDEGAWSIQVGVGTSF